MSPGSSTSPDAHSSILFLCFFYFYYLFLAVRRGGDPPAERRWCTPDTLSFPTEGCPCLLTPLAWAAPLTAPGKQQVSGSDASTASGKTFTIRVPTGLKRHNILITRVWVDSLSRPYRLSFHTFYCSLLVYGQIVTLNT